MESSLLSLAEYFGTTVPTVKLIVTGFFGYLLAFIYRMFLFNKSPIAQWLYFFITGFGLMIFNFGSDAWHSVVSIVFIYFCCHFFQGTAFSVAAAFIFLMSHLLVGYHFTATAEEYNINWTTAECILTLRLIGLVWDLYDGAQPDENLTADQKKTAIKESPSLLEIAAYTYFFGSFLIGPQFPLIRFRKFVFGEFLDPNTRAPRSSSIPVMWFRFILGNICMGAHFYGQKFWPTEYFLTERFVNETFFIKVVHAVIWVRFLLVSYQAAWLINEGSCILSGLGYNGVDQDGDDLWDGVRNIHLSKFEFGCTFRSLLESYNYNTNQWASKYVFKRLKFVGNKTFSQLMTLFFLALWHGWYSGYYVCFFFQYFCFLGERQVSELMSRMPRLQEMLTETWWWYPSWLVQKTIVMSSVAFALLSFSLLTYDKYVVVYGHLYFYGYVGFVLWEIIYFILRFVLPKPERNEENARDHQD